MTRTVRRKATAEPLSPTARATKLMEWVVLQSEAKETAKRMSDIRDVLMADAEANGTEDAQGHLYVDIKPFEFNGKRYEGIKRERRVSIGFDEDKALRLADRLGIRDRVVKTVEVVEQDEFWVLNQTGVITDKQLDSLVTNKVTWAFQQVAA